MKEESREDQYKVECDRGRWETDSKRQRESMTEREQTNERWDQKRHVRQINSLIKAPTRKKAWIFLPPSSHPPFSLLTLLSYFLFFQWCPSSKLIAIELLLFFYSYLKFLVIILFMSIWLIRSINLVYMK